MLSSMTSFTNFKMKKEQIKFFVKKAVGDKIQTGNSCELFIPQSGIKPSLS